MIRKIMVAYDGSKSAERAFLFGLEQAEAFKACVVVLSVAQPPEPPTLVETSALLDSATEHFEENFKHLREEVKQREIPLETKVVVGHAADQIVHHAAHMMTNQRMKAGWSASLSISRFDTLEATRSVGGNFWPRIRIP